MKKLKYQEIYRTLKQNPLYPYYFISGPEEYLRKNAIDLLVRKAAGTNMEQVTIQKMFGDEVEADQLDVSLASYSLFAEKNIIIVKNVRKLKPSCWDIIRNFITNPPETNILILDDEKFDGRKDAVKTAVKNGRMYDFPALKSSELLLWIQKYAQKIGFTITDEAAQYFRDSVDPKLLIYVQEFEKLRLFFDDNSTITLEKLETVTRSTRNFNVFEFIEALFTGEAKRSVELLNHIFIFNESVPGVIVMLVRQLAILLKIKLFKLPKKDPSLIRKTFGLSTFHYNLFKKQAQNISTENLESLLETTLEADTHLKTGYQTDKMVMTKLVHRYLSVINGRRPYS